MRFSAAFMKPLETYIMVSVCILQLEYLRSVYQGDV